MVNLKQKSPNYKAQVDFVGMSYPALDYVVS
jgi:hypothetical protein